VAKNKTSDWVFMVGGVAAAALLFVLYDWWKKRTVGTIDALTCVRWRYTFDVDTISTFEGATISAQLDKSGAVRVENSTVSVSYEADAKAAVFIEKVANLRKWPYEKICVN
jgi:hypothetical protein